jgi:CMP/dCMP kinase
MDEQVLVSLQSMRKLIIAIDGPSGAGKGTVARAIADQLGYRHIDSGAMYRAVGWQAVHDGIDLEREAEVARLAEAADVTITGTAVTIGGIDVTRAIRTPEIDKAAASVARLPRVRTILVDRQRQMAAAGGIVMEGRDIGTVVFPDADVKIYLDASADERARRRANDPAHSGVPAAVAEVATLMTERDRLDTTRASSPLYAAPDALVVDTTGKSVKEVVDLVLHEVALKREEIRN